ncbi:MAG: Wadjet anti-phage system protein JetD domain-containing protein, partial [Phycisphaeraceae bacterium JB051]
NQEMLLAHRHFWVDEPKPESSNLQCLNVEEYALYDQLRRDYWGDRVRLEQEKIGFDFLIKALQEL